MPQFNPGHLDVAAVLVAIARVEVEHESYRSAAHDAFIEAMTRLSDYLESPAIRDRMALGCVRWSNPGT
jgi:hypothetical protein